MCLVPISGQIKCTQWRKLDAYNNIECIGLYTELIGCHCLGADSYLILEEALYDLDAMAWTVM